MFSNVKLAKATATFPQQCQEESVFVRASILPFELKNDHEGGKGRTQTHLLT